ncbi:sugar ABC transporter ATP-binding protein [Jeotgalibacillus soli]|uniref:Autoinducer 2 import ATP-binding protein LsrA n=1 Tax=Jeotgalibacillus soli TaxID=889306 RepID=A0A0C2RHT8_9BACL|nr:sugar ABC transporter ATP-binding protein [Jeotgalibacillus soli]KIL49740.1 ABC transporter [Jeotgalibacillus soli]
MSKLLQMKDIDKSFGVVRVLEKASFELISGEVHALIGANGAGKSTLMKILTGAYSLEKGSIEIDGKPVTINSPADAKAAGIHCVYQEVDTSLVQDMTVAENIAMDQIVADKRVLVSKKRLNEQAEKILAKLNVQLDSAKTPAELTLAEKQMVLIARATSQSARILLFDEPTAPLSLEETKHFFRVVDQLKNEGIGIVFISHRLPEIFELSNRITVMRDGKTIETAETAQTSPQEMVQIMLGRTLDEQLDRGSRSSSVGDELLRVSHLSDGGIVQDVSFSVSSGEVVGIVGLVGAGKTETAKALFGMQQKIKGEIHLNHQPLRLKHPVDAIEAGFALIPEERRKEGLFIEESIRVNTSFPHLKKWFKWLWIQKKKETAEASSVIDRLHVKAQHSEQVVGSLSGGNQQKVAIGKWLLGDAKVFLFDEPTKGVDVGAKAEIFRLIDNLAEQGKGVLYFSCEIDEVIRVSDRILIMYDGTIVKELSPDEVTQDRILLYASGGKEGTNER